MGFTEAFDNLFHLNFLTGLILATAFVKIQFLIDPRGGIAEHFGSAALKFAHLRNQEQRIEYRRHYW